MMPQPPNAKILVLGGYGAFGARAAERLARHGDLAVIVAGRSEVKAREAAHALASSSPAQVSHAVLDATSPDIATLKQLSPTVIINASGPFQEQDYTLVRAAIEAGAHYIDLADDRRFVTGITALDALARAAGVLVTSGASSVPALAAAIVDHHLPDFAKLLSIDHGILPGNAYDPGEATTASILGGLGKPMPIKLDGRWQTVHGWQGLRRYDFPGLGRRWMTHVDVPDLELFPQRYPDANTVRFSAGLEIATFQLGLWALAGIVRRGVISRPERLAPALMAIKCRLRFLGSDAGGMFVRLSGIGHDGRPMQRAIHLLARRNHGPYIPAIASVVLARKIIRGVLTERGARPCMGLFTQTEFMTEISDLAIEIECSPS